MSELLADPKVVEMSVAVLVAFGTLIAAFFGIITKKLTAIKVSSESVDKQVTNAHKTNLRDDVTHVIKDVSLVIEMSKQNQEDIKAVKGAINDVTKTIESEFKQVRNSMITLHEEIDREILDRQALATRVENEHRRLWSRIDCAK